MACDHAERRLAAIMFTGIAGYTALIAENEERGLQDRPLRDTRPRLRSLAATAAALLLVVSLACYTIRSTSPRHVWTGFVAPEKAFE